MARLQLPDEITARLAQLGYQNDSSAWEIGDLAVWIFDYCTIDNQLINPVTEEPMKAYALYDAIGKSAVKSPHSIRDFHYTSKHIPISVREKYHVLGRHHFKALIPHCTTIRELENMADIVMSWSQDDLISVADLRSRLTGQDGGPAKWEKWAKTATNACRKLAEHDSTPDFLRGAAKRFMKGSVHPPLP